MTRLSSKMTFYVKKILPGFLSILFLFIILTYGREIWSHGFSISHLPFLAIFTLIMVGTYWLVARFCLPIFDQVWIEKDDLHVFNWSDEIRIPIDDIVDFSTIYGSFIVIKLRDEYPFERKMMFLPKLQLAYPPFHEDIRLLKEKIAKSKRIAESKLYGIKTSGPAG